MKTTALRNQSKSFRGFIANLGACLCFAALTAGLLAGTAAADGILTDYAAIPPLVNTTGPNDKPNILVILDTSNSMDEAPNGSAVGSDNPGSKSEIARNAVENLIVAFTGKIRMGLMAYQQANISAMKLHNAFYDMSFDPNNYDPNYDLSLPGARDSLTKKYRSPKTDYPAEYVYFNVPLPFYASSNQGTGYCYSPTADFDNGSETYPGGPWDTYRCFSSKSGPSDTMPAWGDTASEAAEGYSGYFGTYGFYPTDSDLAQNILDFGRYLGWNYVGKTWFSNTSPGRGYLHVPIADLDAAQAALLNAKLDVSDFSASADDTPLRNAGLTPLEGTLDTANNYFAGSILPNSEGGPVAAPPANTCSDKDFVIMLTDGLPSTDSSGNTYPDQATAITAVANQAAQLYANNVKVYVVGFALPASVDPTILDQVATAGGTTAAYSASDPASLAMVLSAILSDIMKRASSTTAAAVVSNNSSGVGALYQALFYPSVEKINPNTAETKSVSWAGLLHAIFIDDYGYLREDGDGDGQLDGYDVDKIIELRYYDDPVNETQLVRFNSTSATDPQGLTEESPVSLDDLKPIWSARDQLDALDDAAIISQRDYDDVISATGAGRYIFTWVDNDSSGTAGVVDSTEIINFVWDATGGKSDEINANNYRYLAVADTAIAQNTVDFIRGKEGISGFRSRTIDYDQDGTDNVWLLGDITYSSPAVASKPRASYSAAFGDYTYSVFQTTYANRRQMIYVGGNDGMLHAFNGGFWNKATKAFQTAPISGTAAAHPLGTEVWAYVPMNLLPHLQWLTDPNYPHVYYVDGPPLIADVNIFPADATHPDGWGTILVAGMRFGGGAFSVDTDGDAIKETVMRSAYVIMDITDPESPPQLLAEITDPALGFTTSRPSLAKQRVPGAGANWKNPTTNNWYLVFGSGPTILDNGTSTQNAKLFIYDLAAKTFVSGFGGQDITGLTNSFVGNMSTADWDNDFQDDAVYFGTVGGTPAAPVGTLQRLKLDASIAASTIPELLDPAQPFVSAPSLARDSNGDRWVHAGTGRLFVLDDSTSVTLQAFYGVKETRDTNGVFTWGTVAMGNLQETTDVEVYPDGSIADPGNVLPVALDAPNNTFTKLESYIEDNKAGWYIEFPADGTNPSTRNLNRAVQISSLLIFTDYTPSTESCKPEGTSGLWAVSFKTGTSLPYGPLGTIPGSFNPARVDLGVGLASETILFQGSGTGGKVKAITPNSTGAVVVPEIFLPPSNSGRQSWRELSL